jgi:hypothetical protein
MDEDDDPLVECFFFIPLVGNTDKTPHQALAWNALYSNFQGSTGPELVYVAIRPTPGQYPGRGGDRIRDQSYRYLAAIPASRVDELRCFLRRAANTFDQECIYLSVCGVVEFVDATPDDGFLTDR